jgi:TIR domain
MTIEPSAFWSYVRQVDDHDGGNLSRIREKLSGELQAQTGEKFEVFQDREDIKWGQQWDSRIVDSVNATTFFIPVITPGFFKSEACIRELETFLEREKRLGRNDLILPLYYIDTPELNQKSSDLARTVADRQWFDFREYRHGLLDSPELKRLVSKMASQIVMAINRPHIKNSEKSKYEKVRRRFVALGIEFEETVKSRKLREAQIKLGRLESVITEWRVDLLSFYQKEQLKPLQNIIEQINAIKNDLRAFESSWQVDLDGFVQEGSKIFDTVIDFYDSL